jgi:hypothetical protein
MVSSAVAKSTTIAPSLDENDFGLKQTQDLSTDSAPRSELDSHTLVSKNPRKRRESHTSPGKRQRRKSPKKVQSTAYDTVSTRDRSASDFYTMGLECWYCGKALLHLGIKYQCGHLFHSTSAKAALPTRLPFILVIISYQPTTS